MYDKAIELAKKRYPREWRHMRRLWALSWRIAPGFMGVALFVLVLIVGVPSFLIGRQFGTTNIYNNIPVSALTPTNDNRTTGDKWQPLSGQEIVALRASWRELPVQHFGVLCAIPACADLAESVYGVAHALDWPAAYQSTYMTDATGIHAGIEIWSWPQAGQDVIRDKIANAIERATNG